MKTIASIDDIEKSILDTLKNHKEITVTRLVAMSFWGSRRELEGWAHSFDASCAPVFAQDGKTVVGYQLKMEG